MMKSYAKLALLSVCAVLMLTMFAAADVPGEHPAYRHALTNLHAARALLRGVNLSQPGGENVSRAVGEIDMAIKRIKDAAIDDGKSTDNQPPIDIHNGDNLRRASELLDAAFKEIDEHESNEYARGLKHDAQHHIHAAWEQTVQAMKDGAH